VQNSGHTFAIQLAS